MRLLTALSILLVAACGTDSPTDAGPLTPNDVTALALSVISGDAQADTIDAMLPDPITVQVTDEGSGQPVQGQVVNFVVVEEGCGRAFAGSAATDSLGRAADRWELGTRVGDCSMEVRSVTPSGEVQVFASVTATIDPGQVVDMTVTPPPMAADSPTVFVGDTVNVGTWTYRLLDRAGNGVGVRDAALSLAGTPSVPSDGLRLWSDAETVAALTIQAGAATSRRFGISWLLDLTAYQWTATARCWATDDPFIADSVHVDVVTDTVSYRSVDGRRQAGPRVHVSGTATDFFPDSTRTRVVAKTIAFNQRVGKIEWAVSREPSTSADSVPSSYAGGNWCVEPFVRYDDAYSEGALAFSR